MSHDLAKPSLLGRVDMFLPLKVVMTKAAPPESSNASDADRIRIVAVTGPFDNVTIAEF